jgi:hypothetical protein
MPEWLTLVPAVSQLLDRIIPDPEARAKAKIEMLREENTIALRQVQLALKSDAGQSAINEAEAQHASVFVSGWRPFIGWVCGVAFAYHFVAQPLLAFIIANASGKVTLPAFNMQELSTVLMGMLGLGGLRTLEKIKSMK